MSISMPTRRQMLRLVGALTLTLSTSAYASNEYIADLLDEVIDAPHRSEENRARDRYRHPKETLLFFGLRENMTVVEISPANGWYTEILAPILKRQGKFLASPPALAADAPEPMKRRDAAYKAMVAADPKLYDGATIVNFDLQKPVFGTAGSADMVLTFRNVHNWSKAGTAEAMFQAFYTALKKGGVLGVVEHRARPGTSFQRQIDSGYMTEAYVIETATRAGFKLVASSDINYNPKDTTDHPGGVWNLPPNLRGVAEKDKAKYLAIGESDRMTLKFVKP
ncbi:MAG: methyltransferase [Burkholderiales bacterium]|nr:methyltransferase [Burkholderiales bacterium]